MTNIQDSPALQELIPAPCWVVYIEDKCPYNPTTGKPAEADDPTTWVTYEVARSAATRNSGRFKGIGRELTAEDRLVVIDLDKCIDENGMISAFAQDIVSRVNSYTEISPSGHGLHIWVHGTIPANLPPAKPKADGIEMYYRGHYLTWTDDHLEGTPLAIEDRSAVIQSIYKETTTRRESLKASARLQRQFQAHRSTSASNGHVHYAVAALRDECAILASAQNGCRNDQLNTSAFKMGTLVGAGVLDRNTVESELYVTASKIGLPHAEIEKTLRSGLDKGIQHPRDVQEDDTTVAMPAQHGFPTTDLGNAERFAAQHGRIVRWCEPWKTWMFYNGRCWEQDKTGQIEQLAKKTVRSIYKEAAKESDDTKRGRLVKHAIDSESSGAIRAMLTCAKSELPVLPEAFNTQLDLLNCKNGTLNLQTGELRPHAPEDMQMRCIDIKYNPHAECPLWLSFIKGMFAGDISLVEFVQQGLGMSLSGDIKEQCWFLCHGEGNNGKSTMLGIVSKILASYALAANIESFQVKKNDTANYDQAEFYGKRLITASETQVGKRLNEALMKRITGGERLRAARKYESEFEFDPECTIWLSVNHLPVVKDTSKGMWRRVRRVPFTVSVADSQVDQNLPKKLMKEAEGILAWLVHGCMAWYKQGHLNIPKAVEDATLAYRKEQDAISRFLDEECIFTNKKAKTSTKALNERYEQWCEQNGERLDLKELKATLNARGLHSRRCGHGGSWMYEGISLNDSENTPPDGDGGDGGDINLPKVSHEKNEAATLGKTVSPTVTTVTFTHEFSDTKPENSQNGHSLSKNLSENNGFTRVENRENPASLSPDRPKLVIEEEDEVEKHPQTPANKDTVIIKPILSLPVNTPGATSPGLNGHAIDLAKLKVHFDAHHMTHVFWRLQYHDWKPDRVSTQEALQRLATLLTSGDAKAVADAKADIEARLR